MDSSAQASMASAKSSSPTSSPTTPRTRKVSALTTSQLRELAAQRGVELPEKLPADVAAAREVLLAALEAAGVAQLTQDEVLALTVPSSRRAAEPTSSSASPRSGKLSPRSLSSKLESVATTPADCWGSHKPHAHLSARNLVNALLCAVALLPSIVLSEAALRGCPALAPRPLPPAAGCKLSWGGCSAGCSAQLGGWAGVRCLPTEGATSDRGGGGDGGGMEALCDLAARSPVWYVQPSASRLLPPSPLSAPSRSDPGLAAASSTPHLRPSRWVQLLFLLNVTLGFWLVGLAQRSFWLIDPYWTLLPPLIGLWCGVPPPLACRRPAQARAHDAVSHTRGHQLSAHACVRACMHAVTCVVHVCACALRHPHRYRRHAEAAARAGLQADGLPLHFVASGGGAAAAATAAGAASSLAAASSSSWATAAPLRGEVALALVVVWSARLTHSYFRREGYKFGEREDWRYTQMARDSAPHARTQSSRPQPPMPTQPVAARSRQRRNPPPKLPPHTSTPPHLHLHRGKRRGRSLDEKHPPSRPSFTPLPHAAHACRPS